MNNALSLHQVAAHADDLAASRRFYEDVLGARLIAEFDPPGLVFFDLNGVRLLLERNAPPATLYLRVTDIDQAHITLVERGVVFQHPPALVHRDEAGVFGPAGEAEWMAFFRDPGGNQLALACRR